MPQEKHENFFIELLKFALIAVVIVVPLRLFIAKPFIVSGASMEPTFDTGQYLIVDELSYRFQDPARGNVVIFRYPKDPTQYFIKRIIGLPGETVRIQRGAVSVIETNGNAVDLDESYIVHKGNGGDMQVTLKSGEYFVMGDNRPESSDSRIWGVLPREDIVGRAFVRLLPIQTLGLFPGDIMPQQQ
jgi:signal peptidase I